MPSTTEIQEYRQDVDNVVESVIDRVKEAFEDGTRGEDLREEMFTSLHETIDGCGRVIYTYQAQIGLMCSENDGAYADNYGSEGVVEDGEIQYGRMMYAAMEQDVYEEMDRQGFDPNDPESYFEDDNEYVDEKSCTDSGLHLKSCDDDGYCNHCGQQ